MTAIPCEATEISTADLKKHFASIFALMRRRGWAGPGSRAVTRGACELAIVFVAEVMRKCPGLGLPRAGPSVLGGVGLQWDFGGTSVLVRIESDDPARAHLLVNGPGFHEDDGAGHVSDAFEKVIAMYSRGMSRMDHETPTSSADASRRDRDLAELGDYVRTLADRMGLKDWTFEVRWDEQDLFHPYEVFHEEPSSRRAVVYASPDHPRVTPERQRSLLMAELLYLHTDAFRTYALNLGGLDGGDRFEDEYLAAVAPILEAWAPCLPLPLVGLMRRADEVARP